jgi:hypothetical protein
MASVMDIVTACVVGILINVLDTDTYLFPISEEKISNEGRQRFERDDFNAISKMDRMACTYVRGLSWSLLKWLEENFVFSENDREADFVELTNRLLVHSCIILWRLNRRITEQAVEGAPAGNLDYIKRQLEGLFNENTQLRTQFNKEFDKETDPVDFEVFGYTVRRCGVALPHKYDFSVECMIRLGLNPSDRLYYTSIYGDIDSMMNDICHINEGE